MRIHESEIEADRHLVQVTLNLEQLGRQQHIEIDTIQKLTIK